VGIKKYTVSEEGPVVVPEDQAESTEPVTGEEVDSNEQSTP
jgi:hypothetical protein